MSKIKIAIILGTRPEIIKLAPVIRACKERKIDFFILHSGQHYDHNMDGVFFEELELPKPRYNLHVGSKTFGQHVGMMIKGMKKIMLKELPDAVIVQGDTITVLTGALSAKSWDIPVAHVEAGLRSHDMTMPEEVNRILTDHISDYLFCPTKDSITNVKKESLNAKYYSLTGNTIVDAVNQSVSIADKKFNIVKKLGLKPKKYILLTTHRAENTNDPERLKGILKGFELVAEKYPEYITVFSMHPRTRKKIEDYGLKVSKNIKVMEPLGFLEFLQLEKNAVLVITDSGGLQEECSILHVPVVTVRDNTERPESMQAGMNILAGADPEKILSCAQTMMTRDIKWKPVFGDGHAGERIVDELVEQIKKRKGFKARAAWIKRMIKKNLR